MDVFNKLKSTVSQLSSVLPGNPVTREFEISKHVASGGPGMLWKIYSGFKKSTRQEGSIFVFEKKNLERYSRHERDVILDLLRKGVSQLTRLRHPRILTVQHPLEESRESLAFATEPVFASLANALGNHENLPTPIPEELKDFQLFEVETKYGVLQLCDGLAFLHNDVKLLHGNICPEAIIINKSGAWKICGFEFSVANTSGPDQTPFWPFQEWKRDFHPHANPSLNFMAPEYALTLISGPSSDMFSLGMLIYAIFNQGKTLFGECTSFTTFKKNSCDLKNLSTVQLNSLPVEVREHVRLLLHTTAELRPDAHQFSKIPFFDDVGAKTLEYLDSLFQWDNLQKSQFYKGLPQVITRLPKRVNLYRVVPCLTKEFVNKDMIPFVLPSVLLIAESATKEQFCEAILPHLKTIFKIHDPIQVLLIFMQKMELLLTLTPAEDIKNHVLPLIYRALEADAHQIQELCLNVLPGFSSLIDYPSMKNSLLPRMKKLCLSTPYLSVRVNCLVCLGKLLENLDRWLVLDEVLPLLPEIPSREPAVLMGIIGIYKITMNHKKLGITKEMMANKVLPFLLPISIENGLNLSQFTAVMALVKEMIQKIECEHRGKLEQLTILQQEQRKALDIPDVKPIGKGDLLPEFTTKTMTETEQMFGELGLANYVQERTSAKTNEELYLADSKSPSIAVAKSVTVTRPSSGYLSLEEKQKLADHQNQMQRNRTPQPQIKPVTVMATVSSAPNTNVPRDMMDTLIRSNLTGMTTTQAPHSTSTAFTAVTPVAMWQPMQPMVRPQVQMDLRPFDNLMPCNEGAAVMRPSMNQMASQRLLNSNVSSSQYPVPGWTQQSNMYSSPTAGHSNIPRIPAPGMFHSVTNANAAGNAVAKPSTNLSDLSDLLG